MSVFVQGSWQGNTDFLRIGAAIKMSMIYLIRHGKTKANEKHLYCGSTDLPLSEKGIAELRENTEYMQQCIFLNSKAANSFRQQKNVENNVKFLTSGMKRTEQTLEILFGNVSHDKEVRFREVDFGSFEMRSYEELKEQWEYQQWLSGDNERNVPPEGESGWEMKRRVMEAFRELEKKQQNTVVITHGGVIAAIMKELFPKENKNRYEWQPKPGYGYMIYGGTAGASEKYKKL